MSTDQTPTPAGVFLVQGTDSSGKPSSTAFFFQNDADQYASTLTDATVEPRMAYTLGDSQQGNKSSVFVFDPQPEVPIQGTQRYNPNAL